MLKVDGEKLQFLIAQTGLSVRAWGIKNHFPQSTLQAWISNRRNIKTNQLYRLAECLSCEPNDIAHINVKYDKKAADQYSKLANEIKNFLIYLTPKELNNLHKYLSDLASKRFEEEQDQIKKILEDNGMEHD